MCVNVIEADPGLSAYLEQVVHMFHVWPVPRLHDQERAGDAGADEALEDAAPFYEDQQPRYLRMSQPQ